MTTGPGPRAAAINAVGPLRLRALVTATLALLVLLALAGTAFAHAQLVESSPANQAVLETSPADILLTFTEGVDPIDPGIRVVDATGGDVSVGSVDQSQGSDTMRVSVSDPLDDGSYVVAWQAVSADSHKVRGAFTFSVGAASATTPGLVDDIFAESGSSDSDSLLLGAGRFASFAGIAVLLGALVMVGPLAPGVAASARVGRVLVVAAAVAAIGTVWMIAAQAHLIAGSYWDWGAVADTRSGGWWLLRLLGVGILAAAIPLRGRLPALAGQVVVTVLAVALLGVVAAGGHAVSGDNVAVGVVATMVHLGAMTIWLGGLAVLLAGVDEPSFWPTAARLSPWALGSVVVLTASGGANAWRQLGSIGDLTGSSYGRWLVVKLFLVALVLVVAGFSRRTLRSAGGSRSTVDPSVRDPATTAVGAATRSPGYDPPIGALRRSVLLEAAGIALVLMATAGLVNAPPPLAGPSTSSASAIVGERIVQVELEPAVTGGTEMHVYLTSPGGGLDQADEITVSAELGPDNLGPIDLLVVPAGPNHVIGPDVDLPVAGLWTFEVTARFGEFDQVIFTVQIPVVEP